MLVTKDTQSFKKADVWDSRGVRVLFQLAKVFGIRATSIKSLRHKKRFGVICAWRLLQAILILFAVVIGVVDSFRSWKRYKVQLSKLDFTTVTMSIFRACYISKAAITIVIIICQRQEYRRILTAVGRACSKQLGAASRIRKIVNYLAIWFTLWSGMAVAGIIWAVVKTFSIAATRSATVNGTLCWSCNIEHSIFLDMPIWMICTLYAIMMFFDEGLDVYPQLLICLIVLAITLCFKNVKNSVKEIAHNPLIPLEYHEERIKSLAAMHLELSQLVLQFDKLVSLLMFMLYGVDMMGFISLTSFAMYKHGTIFNSYQEHDIILFACALVIISAVNSSIRTVLAVNMSEQAHSALPYLHKMSLRIKSSEGRFALGNFVSRLENNRVAMTIGGFMYITREAAFTIFGLLVTYVLFVYQMQDQKQDLGRLPTLEQIVSASPRLPAAWLMNTSRLYPAV